MNDSKRDVLGNVLSAIKVIETYDTLDELLDGISVFSKPLGFTHAGIGQIINPAVLDRPITDVGISDFPIEFNDRWLSNPQSREHGRSAILRKADCNIAYSQACLLK